VLWMMRAARKSISLAPLDSLGHTAATHLITREGNRHQSFILIFLMQGLEVVILRCLSWSENQQDYRIGEPAPSSRYKRGGPDG
jgi:hypothetical protein